VKSEWGGRGSERQFPRDVEGEGGTRLDSRSKGKVRDWALKTNHNLGGESRGEGRDQSAWEALVQDGRVDEERFLTAARSRSRRGGKK